MIDAMTRGVLGEFGSAILDFYQQYALWINLTIFVYAFILWRAKKAYSIVKKNLVVELEKKFGEKIHQKDLPWFKNIMQKNQLDWQNLSKSTRNPIISTQKSLWFKIKSPKSLQEHFTPERVHTILQNDNSQGR
jgi:hypothetical protein